jgi:hypothetical protein
MLSFTATVLAFHLISKASRPEFETLAAPEQAPDRDSAMHGLRDSIASERRIWKQPAMGRH